MTTMLRIDSLRAGYGKVEVLHGVSLVVPQRRMVAIVGPNGAGKTTLMSAIMGLLPRTAGSVHYCPPSAEHGSHIYASWPGSARPSASSRSMRRRWMPATSAATRFGVTRFNDSGSYRDAPADTTESLVASGAVLVPERRALFADMRVEDNLLLGAYTRHRAGDRDAPTAMREVFALFPRLQERRHQLAGTLSGGERQMLALGRALMARPRLLLLDEPSLGLAPLLVREIFRVLTDLRARGLSILLVEQNVRAALQISDYAYVLEMGTIAAEGPSNELANDPRILETYLGQRRGSSPIVDHRTGRH